jgi:hypothetical protein
VLEVNLDLQLSLGRNHRISIATAKCISRRKCRQYPGRLDAVRDFFSNLPPSWQDIRFIAGAPGKFFVLAKSVELEPLLLSKATKPVSTIENA